MAKIFIVEDEIDIRDILTHHLVRAGHDVAGSGDGETALKLLLERQASGGETDTLKPDLVILDLMLPGLSGFDICRRLRQDDSPLRQVPILMLTAKSQTSDIVAGLELGADDYLVKPFEISEVQARVKALLRRGPAPLGRPDQDEPTQVAIYKQGVLTVDTAQFKAWVEGDELELTTSEFRLLQALMEINGGVLTRSQLIQKIRGDGIFVIDRTIDFHILGLRRKLGKAGPFIETVRGVGYRFQHEA